MRAGLGRQLLRGGAFDREKRERRETAVEAAAHAFIPVMPLAFKSSPPETPSILAPLAEDTAWSEVVEDFARRLPRRRERIAAYRALLADGTWRTLAAGVLAGRYRFAPPLRCSINRDGGARRKTVFSFGVRDELVLRAVGRVLRPTLERLLPEACHSFRRGRGARTAFRALLADPRIGRKAWLRLDLADYFNSIPVDRLLEGLPAPLAADRALRPLLERLLLDRRAIVDGRVVTCGPRGVMAGTPLAPPLSNLYLREVDLHFAASTATYVRYSDDIAIFDDPARLAEHDAWLVERLAHLGLAVNPTKTRRGEPGEPWEFLGLCYRHGVVDVAAHSARKLKKRLRRLARVYERARRRRRWDPDEAARRFVRRVNRKIYGVMLDADELCWARWFFPVLTTDATLAPLDVFIREKVRYVASGRHRSSDGSRWPRERLRALGYVPLVSAYWEHRRSPEHLARLLLRRIGAPPQRRAGAQLPVDS